MAFNKICNPICRNFTALLSTNCLAYQSINWTHSYWLNFKIYEASVDFQYLSSIFSKTNYQKIFVYLFSTVRNLSIPSKGPKIFSVKSCFPGSGTLSTENISRTEPRKVAGRRIRRLRGWWHGDTCDTQSCIRSILIFYIENISHGSTPKYRVMRGSITVKVLRGLFHVICSPQPGAWLSWGNISKNIAGLIIIRNSN